MRSTLRLGSIAGISININISWLVIFVLLTASLAIVWFPSAVLGLPSWLYWTASTITAILFFGSVLAHELAHSLVARRHGLPVKSITLFIFGGVASIEREPQRAGVEFQMALAGPLTSLIIGGVAIGAGFGASVLAWPALVVAMFFYVGLANLALGVFNLIPGFPMDGGRVLRSIIWRVTGNLRKATIWAANVGQFVAYLMIVVGVWLFFWNGRADGIWIGLIGLFILQAARAEITRVELEAAIEGATVQQFMAPQPPLVTPDLSLRQFVDDYLLRAGQRTVAVVERGSRRLIGMVTLQDVRQVPQELWSSAVIGQIMTPLARLKTLRPEQPVSDALTLLAEARVGHLPVVSADGEVVGMLSLASLLEYLQMERDLGVRASKTAERELERPPLSKVG